MILVLFADLVFVLTLFALDAVSDSFKEFRVLTTIRKWYCKNFIRR